ncbi:hypothetical protein DICVIV_00449 [Dictyocaulus viviparus]|uniref:Uncharacterized protein n=1 Tax=Dictyocaulus viviparus TaxID=29172 RepID=A0A0D8YFA6_DICVI|nr:hypothetical protein DICVIV_00449 [Dictyocaulus viviparus]
MNSVVILDRWIMIDRSLIFRPGNHLKIYFHLPPPRPPPPYFSIDVGSKRAPKQTILIDAYNHFLIDNNSSSYISISFECWSRTLMETVSSVHIIQYCVDVEIYHYSMDDLFHLHVRNVLVLVLPDDFTELFDER